MYSIRSRKRRATGNTKHVYAVLPYTTGVVAAMIELQLLTGMRPGELCLIRPCDLDRSGPVWHYYQRRDINNYYNTSRTHLSLEKDAPIRRPVQTDGKIISKPILGGLHHVYRRVA